MISAALLCLSMRRLVLDRRYRLVELSHKVSLNCAVVPPKCLSSRARKTKAKHYQLQDALLPHVAQPLLLPLAEDVVVDPVLHAAVLIEDQDAAAVERRRVRPRIVMAAARAAVARFAAVVFHAERRWRVLLREVFRLGTAMSVTSFYFVEPGVPDYVSSICVFSSVSAAQRASITSCW